MDKEQTKKERLKEIMDEFNSQRRSSLEWEQVNDMLKNEKEDSEEY